MTRLSTRFASLKPIMLAVLITACFATAAHAQTQQTLDVGGVVQIPVPAPASVHEACEAYNPALKCIVFPETETLRILNEIQAPLSAWQVRHRENGLSELELATEQPGCTQRLILAMQSFALSNPMSNPGSFKDFLALTDEQWAQLAAPDTMMVLFLPSNGPVCGDQDWRAQQ